MHTASDWVVNMKVRVQLSFCHHLLQDRPIGTQLRCGSVTTMNEQKTTLLSHTGWRRPLALEATGPSGDCPGLLILLQISGLSLAEASSIFHAIHSEVFNKG